MESSAGRSGLLQEFQAVADDALIRHRSLLDVMSKLQESQARLARATAIAVTVCGCITVEAQRQRIPADAELADLHEYVHSHIQGALCSRCREEVESELGQLLFYQTALATLFDISLEDIVTCDLARLKTLGVFNLS